MATTLEDKLNNMLDMIVEELDTRAQAYENNEIEFSDKGEIRSGSPFDYIGSKRETFVLDAEDFRDVTQAMKLEGCSKSTLYCSALREYLEKRGLSHA